MYVDKKTLEELRIALGGEKSRHAVSKLIRKYLKETTRRLEMMQEARGKEGLEVLQRTSHGIKGISGYFGAHGLSKLSAEMEKLARSGDVQGAGKLVKPIQEEFKQVRTFLEQECAKKSSSAESHK